MPSNRAGLARLLECTPDGGIGFLRAVGMASGAQTGRDPRLQDKTEHGVLTARALWATRRGLASGERCPSRPSELGRPDGGRGEMATKSALITGISGKDGSYLAELLLSKGYDVHGIVRRASTFNNERLDPIYQDPHYLDRQMFLHCGDLTDSVALVNLFRDIQPGEVYHLGAQSRLKVSFEIAAYTADTTGTGTIHILEAVRPSKVDTRFYQASSSEMYGSMPPPQHEGIQFHPRSPYGVAKVFGYWATVNYREAYDMFAVNGILFYHESPRRGEALVTRKVARAVARIKNGLQDKIYPGNLDAVRDWGYAKGYVEGIWLMLQASAPTDYVLATGVATTVRKFCQAAFGAADLDWQDYVVVDPRYHRPSEVDALIGDPTKAREALGWKAETDWRALSTPMVEGDLQAVADKLAGPPVRVDR
jgi:GDPmannose 4,6-dehydratase